MSKFPKFASLMDSLGKVDWNSLKDQYMPTLASSLAGATLGGGGMALATHRNDDESDEDFRSRRLSAITGGALAGGAAGLALPKAVDLFKSLDDPGPPKPRVGPPTLLDRAVHGADVATKTPITVTAGAIGGGALAAPTEIKVLNAIGEPRANWSGRKQDLISSFAKDSPNFQAALQKMKDEAGLPSSSVFSEPGMDPKVVASVNKAKFVEPNANWGTRVSNLESRWAEDSPAFRRSLRLMEHGATVKGVGRIAAHGIAPAAIIGGATLLPMLVNKIKASMASTPPVAR